MDNGNEKYITIRTIVKCFKSGKKLQVLFLLNNFFIQNFPQKNSFQEIRSQYIVYCLLIKPYFMLFDKRILNCVILEEIWRNTNFELCMKCLDYNALVNRSLALIIITKNMLNI